MHDLSGLINQIISSSEQSRLGVTLHSFNYPQRNSWSLPFTRALQRPTPQSTAHIQLCLVESSFLSIETDCPQTRRCYRQRPTNLVKILHTFSYEVRMWNFKRLVVFPVLLQKIYINWFSLSEVCEGSGFLSCFSTSVDKKSLAIHTAVRKFIQCFWSFPQFWGICHTVTQ